MFCTTPTLGMLEFQFPWLLNLRLIILLKIVQVTHVRLDFVEMAMLITHNYARDFGRYAT
jgi:hypothetical protein